ncbi:MAG: nucleotide sugar dehydrogenase [Planctomycetota bacterium]|nr:nucleotide sugar dehydrogenase [Planctomycetota bacterium]MDP7251699.1 nucleotide sugar dehydrogenase [Planctomycetota bacterium]
MSELEALEQRIRDKSAHIGVVGMGYVGLPLGVAMAKAGFRTTCIDVDPRKVELVNQGRSHVQDIPDEVLAPLVKDGLLDASDDPAVISELDAISICVPTPLRKTKEPDMTFIDKAVGMIAENMKTGSLIVLESTTYPGTTEEVALHRLEQGGWKVGEDFLLAFSPERIDPGNKTYTVENTPKIVGGITARCTEVAAVYYEQFIEEVVRVSSARAAEMVKLLENTFRAVNIGLVNELALMCDRMDIDVWEIVDAAATKPFGFMPFYPGPGLGGHCLPVDPHYLSWKAKTYEFYARFIELASEINSSMPEYVFQKISIGLNQHRKCINGSKVLVLGVSYKRDVGDIRESPALDVMELLRRAGADLAYHDPYVEKLAIGALNLRSTSLEDDTVGNADCVVLMTDHTCFDLSSIAARASLIIDTRNATKNVGGDRANIIKL